MVTAHFGIFCHFRSVWGSEKLVCISYLQLQPTKCKIISTKLLYNYKVSSFAFLEKKNIALNISLVLFLHHAIQYVFRTCKIDIFTLFLDLKISTCKGSQKMFFSVVIRANIGLFISGEKNWGNCILLWQYCLKTRLFPPKREKCLFKGLFTILLTLCVHGLKKKTFFLYFVDGKDLGSKYKKNTFQIIIQHVAMVTAHLSLGHLRLIWGSEKLFFVNIYNSTPPKSKNISLNRLYICTKYHPWFYFRQQIIAIKVHTCATELCIGVCF